MESGKSVSAPGFQRAVGLIREAAQRALAGDLSRCLLKLPKRVVFGVRYKQHFLAYRAGFYPGAKLVEPHTVRFETDDFGEVLRMKLFT
jgi:D-amino peptidase